MENTNKGAIFNLIFLLAGLAVGWMVWGGGHKVDDRMSSGGTHQMADGTMMNNSGDMANMMASMNTALLGKTGDEFDKAFLTEMIVHHQGAVSMAEMVLSTSTRPELKKLASDIISAQNKEIQMMKDWQQNWFK